MPQIPKPVFYLPDKAGLRLTLFLLLLVPLRLCWAEGSQDEPVELETVVVEGEKLSQKYTKLGPGEGLLLNKEQIPGNVQSISSQDMKESMTTSLGDLMNSRLQSVNINDYQGNPFQMDISYRGFSASPQIGTPQGLSVFLDGIRVNEPFGDIVNWDLIPMNALSGMDVFPGSNPLFGLNTLRTPISLKPIESYNAIAFTFDGRTSKNICSASRLAIEIKCSNNFRPMPCFCSVGATHKFKRCASPTAIDIMP